jgi:hypothetical protein
MDVYAKLEVSAVIKVTVSVKANHGRAWRCSFAIKELLFEYG